MKVSVDWNFECLFNNSNLLADLCIKDAELSFKAMEFGSLKYIGQVRMMPVYQNNEMMGGTPQQRAQQGTDQVIDYEYAKCGYGKMIWPDQSSFEGYWIDGQACGLGIFRAPGIGDEVYEGFWQ